MNILGFSVGVMSLECNIENMILEQGIFVANSEKQDSS